MAKSSASKTENNNAPDAGTVSTETAPKGQQYVKKISNEIFKSAEIGTKILLGGIVRGMETKTSTLGEYTKFTGDFAVKVGEQITRSGVLYVPAVAADILKNGYAAAMDAQVSDLQAKNPSCEFSFFIVKVANEKSNTGYVWAVETRQEIKPETDKVLQLLG